jgi:preprotein translocase subunit Sec63
MAPNLNSSDYYEILGVPKNADDAALKKAYKKLAVKVRRREVDRHRVLVRRIWY